MAVKRIASWKKCDFQVHSPRDPNFTGGRPVGVGDCIPGTDRPATRSDVKRSRKEWARQFVEECLARNLHAVAITDHHELVMAHYVKQEVDQRRSKDSNFELWFYPGMELTATNRKQCIVLFDPIALNEKELDSIPSVLHVQRHPKECDWAAKAKPPQPLNYAYPEIETKLAEQDYLKGKYLVLPNMSAKGNNSVLVNGGQRDFRELDCVGGYLDKDQTVDDFSDTNKTRISGKSPKWTSRVVHAVPTSDSRSSKYKTLGTNNCWIKIAESTVEAVRQAFLAHKSRIYVGEEPPIPSIYISRVQVSNSSILGTVDIPLSPEMNCLIGGRGSGKSTLLEYISFGLGRSTFDFENADKAGVRRPRNLIKDTLTKYGGEVKLTVHFNGSDLLIVRSKETNYDSQISQLDGDDFEEIEHDGSDANRLREILPAVVYGQRALNEIGKEDSRKLRLADLMPFVDPDHKYERRETSEELLHAKDALRGAIQANVNMWPLVARKQRLESDVKILRGRLRAIQKHQPQLPPNHEKLLTEYENYSRVERWRKKARRDMDDVVDILDELTEYKSTQLSSKITSASLRISKLIDPHDRFHKALSSGAVRLANRLDDIRKQFLDESRVWGTQFKKVQARRKNLLEELGERESVQQQAIEIKEQIAERVSELESIDLRLPDLKVTVRKYDNAKKQLSDVSLRESKRTSRWVREIKELSSGSLTAKVKLDGDLSEMAAAMQNIVARGRAGESRVESALQHLTKEISGAELHATIRDECLLLLQWRESGQSAKLAPSTPFLDKLLPRGASSWKKMLRSLSPGLLQDLAVAVPTAEISLLFNDGKSSIDFDKASEGQRAAALLHLLLHQGGGPLVVDQPEDDLDNRFISGIADRLHVAKRDRQVIFASHNANIVVNGSSEFVGHLVTNEDGSKQVKEYGAIDVESIRAAITSVMEGGEASFKDRQRKYGF